MSEPSPVVRPAPDPERDLRVARRRAADAARASRALDRLMGLDCLRPGGPNCFPCGRIECQIGDGE